MKLHSSIYAICVITLVFLLTSEAQGVAYAEDNILIYENGHPITGGSGIVSYGIYKEVLESSVFYRSQAHSTNLTFYKTNKTNLMTYNYWTKTLNNNLTSYNEYIENEMENSLYNISISLPVPTDTNVHNFYPRTSTDGIIGTDRYFSVYINTTTLKANFTQENLFYLIVYNYPLEAIEHGSTFIISVGSNVKDREPNVTVTFNDQTYQTDDNGNVTITAPALEGTYPLQAIKPGYIEQSTVSLQIKYTPIPIGFPGFELILALFSITLVLLWNRKRIIKH